MSRNFIIGAVVVLVVVISLIYALQGGQTTQDYYASIKKEREEKDRFMRVSSESPFKEAELAFTGLKYYDPDVRYKVTARLIPIREKQLRTLSTNDGLEKRYMEYAYAEFEIGNYTQRLLILEIIDMGPYRGTLFLAFGDATSAKETYGAGRYIDIKKPAGNTLVLDFNTAYNPYCAYAEEFSCPLPPKENLLEVAIRAGEKNYHED
ncbi:MAG TPA: DUF1684 domain-containing protein [Cyclobacteriaceae bacterium]|nr:DUF1684 domain-containing protein [Cyclobacteriaceae bacterium]